MRRNYSEDWQDKAEKKRGVRYLGEDEYYATAELGDKDTSLHGSAGDAFSGDWYDPELVAKALEDGDPALTFHKSNIEEAALLRKLFNKTSGANTLYHGSPVDVEELIPQQATGQGSAEHRRNAVYATKDPKEALLYAIMSRPGLGGYALAEGKAHYVEGRPLNEKGYVYEVPGGDYVEPEDPRAGIALERNVIPTSRKEVLLEDVKDRLVSYPTKEEYKQAVRDLLSKSASLEAGVQTTMLGK